jgi:hypothetical protein
MLGLFVYIASDPRPSSTLPTASCPTIPIVELTSLYLSPLFSITSRSPFCNPFLFTSMQESGVAPLPLRFPRCDVHTSKRVNGLLPIPFPFTLLRTLWHGQKLNSFVFKRLRTLYPKHRGWGYHSILYSPFPRLRTSQSVRSSTEHGSPNTVHGASLRGEGRLAN